MKLGDVDVLNSLLDSELRIKLLERVLNYLLEKNPSLTKPTQSQLNVWTDEIVQQLQNKYPNTGIKYERHLK